MGPGGRGGGPVLATFRPGREAAATSRRVRDALREGGSGRLRGSRCCAGPERERKAVGCGSPVPPGVAAARTRGATSLVLRLWGRYRQTSRGEEDGSEQGGDPAATSQPHQGAAGGAAAPAARARLLRVLRRRPQRPHPLGRQPPQEEPGSSPQEPCARARRPLLVSGPFTPWWARNTSASSRRDEEKADLSLYPHLYSRAYINFRNPDDILLFRDRFDGYIFIDSKGLEYPAVVEFAPFQKIAKKKLKKKDAKTGSIEDDPEYKKFLETYCVEEEKPNANPETLLGDIEAKTRELIGGCDSVQDAAAVSRRTTPLLEYIRNRKLEKQRIREEKREERRRRELEKRRLREEEKRKKREEERCKRKEADRQKRAAEREVRIKLLKKPEKGEEPTENPKERGEEVDIGDGKREPYAVLKSTPLGGLLEEPREKLQNDSDKEQREMERRFREKEPETQRCHMDDSRKHRAHCEFDKFSRRNEEELKWGKRVPSDRGKKGSQDSGIPVEAAKWPGREHRSEGSPAPKAERPGNKDRPALQLYQPGARIRAQETAGGISMEGRDGSRGEAEDSGRSSSQQSEEAGEIHISGRRDNYNSSGLRTKIRCGQEIWIVVFFLIIFSASTLIYLEGINFGIPCPWQQEVRAQPHDPGSGMMQS
ncbi:regulator of nonsense transcripts 3A isoform X4 [Zalophus californianus]|uniref:Regulator of nonsense transcripts 3A isoform X4 n=1 Tax=Zalophus californianus TaxID=9704 RepID=A0A6J2CPQ7_ZALCA|nr:regulator of nonsense transcripts 3A isoform X4 [Zalophus californianus]